jgi:hypothetical protein
MDRIGSRGGTEDVCMMCDDIVESVLELMLSVTAAGS